MSPNSDANQNDLPVVKINEIKRSVEETPESNVGSKRFKTRDGVVHGEKVKKENQETPQKMVSDYEIITQTEAKKKNTKKKKMKTKNMDPKLLKVRRGIQQCCATDNLMDAISIYRYALKHNIRIEAQTFYNLINLCDGLSNRGVHIGTPKANSGKKKKNEKMKCSTSEMIPLNLQFPDLLFDENQREINDGDKRNYAFEIRNRMKKASLPLNETAYTALIRILAKSNDFKMAEEVLSEAEECQQCRPKLRMYSSLLIAHCKLGNMEEALRLWERMAKIKGSEEPTNIGEGKIELSEREYCAMMECATKVGDEKVMERVLSDLAEDILVPSTETSNVICSWFRSKFSSIENEDSMNNSSIEKVKLPFSDAPSLGPLHCQRGYSWDISHGVRVDPCSGTLLSGCMKGVKLKPVALSRESWINMIEMNETIVLRGSLEGDNSEFAGGGKGKKRLTNNQKSEEKRKRKWANFKRYLHENVGPPAEQTETESPPQTNLTLLKSENKESNQNENIQCQKYDIVIDGANIGYYKQNFANAPKHVDYRQIDWVVQHFAKQSKRILLVLHERHFSPHMVPKWAEAIVEKWVCDKVLYKTPFGSDDDWFWMHAALWCGRSTMVVSNDQMRDHFFQMLMKRSFARWRERHQVHFNFGNWYTSSDGKKREVELTYPDVYSRRIQYVASTNDDGNRTKGLVIPIAKKGDERRFLDGSHAADNDAPNEETYICLMPTKLS